MSNQESNFIKWFGGIAATLVVAAIIGLIGMYRAQAVNSERIVRNEMSIETLHEYHKADVLLIRGDQDDVKDDLKEIKADIKKLLQAVR